ncbi:MAG: gamma-glutamyl-gamma-aminobutyrate hydrolase family protein [Candidatus Saccharicenans sp.]|nr:gamma-glutamyl-gamma-aminobutyrate hydrolase family protein [Candidatus Saccharicenans sp.]
MRPNRLLPAILIFLVLFFGLTTPPLKAQSGEVRLTVFYPSIGTIRNIQALRENSFLDLPGLKVTGLYHLQEATNYEEARRYVRDNGLDWFTFQAFSADLGPDNIFKTNGLTAGLTEIFRQSDGIIFFGGPDIPPAVWGERTSLLTEITDPYRHYFELSAIFHLLGGYQDPDFRPLLEENPELPVLGICLGAQSLNVGTGGTLIQDIWSEVYGQNYVEDIIALGPDRWHNNPFIKLRPDLKLSGYSFHWIKLLPDGFFVRTLGFSDRDRPRILSSHHQAFKKPGRGFKVIAVSPDGKIPEAIHHTKYPNVLGLQFHPEHYRLWDRNLQIRFKPDDKPTSYHEILSSSPPSLEFHRRIWQWLNEAMKKNRLSRPRLKPDNPQVLSSLCR